MCEKVMAIEKAIIDTEKELDETINQQDESKNDEIHALYEFHYRSGYELSLSDLGKSGVKIELSDNGMDSAAVVLPPEKTKECSQWLSKTMGLQVVDLPHELSKILKRLLDEKDSEKILERGDKKILKQALKLLKNHN